MMSSGGTATASRSSGTSTRFPFTPNQWQELEHQALVYKYMISGMPIPPDLLFTIKRSLDSPPNSKLMLHHTPLNSMGWNCFQMGFGRKIDPEPGRCRRTDGKKWRCSKEAYPDSKYCERHMHRGRNRSRKPVEVNANNNNNLSTQSQTSPVIPPTAIPISSINKSSPNYPSSMATDLHNQQVSYNGGNGFLYSNSPSSRNMGFPSLSSQDPFPLDSASYSHSDKDFRNYGHGMMMKDEVDEHPFFSETSGSTRSVSDSWHLEPLTMGSSKQNGYSSYLQQSRQQKQDDDHHYYHDIGLKMEREDEPQKVMHHFFDEWPHKNNDSSTTQLSISMPISSHDFFMTHNDK